MPPKHLPTLPAGQSLGNDRYRIAKKLGEGGFGSVYLAHDSRLSGRKVAIKELLDASPDAQELFSREAMILAQLNHPGLVRVSDFFSEGRSYYMVMDFIEGRDLLAIAIEADKNRQGLPVERALDWVIQICDALAYLHRQNPPVVHRDIKPNNIRITPQNQAVLVDFGIAKIDPKARTQNLAKAISVGFSPPEQYSGGGGTDTRSDVYALGATLYCLLTLQPPPDAFERLTKERPLSPPRQVNPAACQAVEDLTLKAMTLNVNLRYQDGSELLAALQAALESQRTSSASTAPSSASGVMPSLFPCPHCSRLCRSTARFCPSCGASFESTQRCPACGASNRPMARFCSKCRTPLHSTPQLPKVDSQQARQSALLGDGNFQAGQYSKALKDYEQAVLFGLEDPAVIARLGQCYLHLQRYDDAVGFLESQIRRYPKEAAIHAHLSSAYLGAGKYAQGIQTLELACNLAPNDDEMGLLLSRFYFEWGRHVKAIPLLERIMKNRPKDIEIRSRLAVAYLIANRVKDADLIVKGLQREKPNEVELAFLMGMVNLRKGNPKQALKDFQRVVKQAPDYALAHYFIGEIYFEQKLWREASMAYLFSARASTHDAEPHAKLCLCYIEMNRPADAAAALQRALQIDPTHELALKIARQISV